VLYRVLRGKREYVPLDIKVRRLLRGVPVCIAQRQQEVCINFGIGHHLGSEAMLNAKETLAIGLT